MFATLPNFNQLDEDGFRVSAVGGNSAYAASSSPGGGSSVYAGSGGITAPLPTPAATHSARDLPEIETLNVELCKDNQGKSYWNFFFFSVFFLKKYNSYVFNKFKVLESPLLATRASARSFLAYSSNLSQMALLQTG
jgi:hypothetical protein